MNEQKTIYIISGPLGVGKTTVSKKLTGKLSKSSLIEGDIFFNELEKEKNISWEERLRLTWENLLSLTKDYLGKNLNVVIDFVVENELPWFLNEISDLNVKVKYVVLIADEKTLASRLEKRGEAQYLGRSLVLLNKLSKNSFNQKHIIDATNKNIPEIIEEVLTDKKFVAKL